MLVLSFNPAVAVIFPAVKLPEVASNPVRGNPKTKMMSPTLTFELKAGTAQLKLNADWVVLSACNTAAGDKPGAEASSGLARAFFSQGPNH
jgi:CHAT domain-containing protein